MRYMVVIAFPFSYVDFLAFYPIVFDTKKVILGL